MSNQEKLDINAVNGSTAVGSISVGGDIGGDINIGNTGYTANQVSILLAQIQSTFQPKPFDGRCPYKGLDVFEVEDAELFFGREKLVDDLVSRVKDSRTVFVTGPSGSGKSSLARAGLIHALKQGAIKGSDRWLYATMKPGRDPIGELGRVVSSLASSTNPEDEIRSKAMKDATIFARWCEIVLKEGRDKRLVLFIDQFEEVFTQISNEEERIAFLNLLTHAATIENGRVIILFSMRSDFVSNCATYPQLNALLNQQFVQIGAMQPEELVSAIAQPALRVGLRIDPDLIAQIINEMKGEPGALPLMQFALKDLFDFQQEKNGVIALTLNDYLQRGGIHKALERHANDSFSKLSKNEQELARSIFSGLIEIGRGTQDTKRTALFDELVPANAKAADVEVIVQKLADARLITTDEQAGKDTVTISHEKLIDAWPWLKKLVNENRDVIALQNQIATDAKEWEGHKHDASYLYTGGRLANVRERVDKQKLTFNQLAQEFIRTAKARQLRMQAFLISAVSVVLITAIVASVVFQNQAQANIEIANTAQAASTFAIAQQERAQANADEALARQLVIQAQSLNFAASSNQMVSSLLNIQSMKLFNNGDAASFLINSNFSAHPISRITHDNAVNSVAFSPDGKYVVSGSYDNTARVSEVSTGKEIARMTHDGEVYTVAFSPDGKYVVSGSNDNTARVWEAGTGKEIARMLHNAEVNSVAFSPDGKYVLSGSTDYTARVWEAGTGKEIARMLHNAEVNSVAFSPDGKYVLSGSTDYTARVWEASIGKEIARMTHDFLVSSVAFSPDGKYALSGSEDATARVWETSTGNEIARMLHNGPVSSIAFSPNGKYALSGSYDNTARVWEVSTGYEMARMTHDSFVDTVAFSPDGKYALSGSYDNTARVSEANTGKEIARMTHDSYVYSVAFSPDGKYVVSGSADNTARIWEASTGKEIVHMTHDSYVDSVAFSSDGKYVISGSADTTARVWEASTGNEIARMTHDGEVYTVAFSPDGKYVISGSADTTARVWEAGTGKEIARMTHNSLINSVVFSPDGKYVISGSADTTARVWESSTGKEIARMTHDGEVSSIAFSPDSKYVVSGSYDATVHVWEASTGKEIARMDHTAEVSSVAFSPDGKYVVSGSADNTARVWEASTGKEIAHIDHTVEVSSVAFSSDGKYVLSGSYDATARVWEASTGNEIARMTHDGEVYTVAFSPDGKYVISGSYDSTARVWEASTGKEIARMTHNSLVNSVAFSPDGKYVLSGSYDAIARMWEWQTQDLIANACTSMPRNLIRAEWQKYIGDALPYQAVCPNLSIEAESTPMP